MSIELSNSTAPRKVHLISLGCARNRVDSEVMLGTMMGKGWKSTDVAAEAEGLLAGFGGRADDPALGNLAHYLSLRHRDLRGLQTGSDQCRGPRLGPGRRTNRPAPRSRRRRTPAATAH